MKLSRISLLLCAALLLPACGKSQVSIDEQLAELKTEREALMARVAEVEDESMRGNLDMMARMVFWMREGEIETSHGPEKIAYVDDPLAVVDDYDTIDMMARNYIGGITATQRVKYLPDHTDLKLPFPYPFEHSVRFHTAILADGTRLPVTDDFDRAAPYRKRQLGGGDEGHEDDGPGLVYQGSSGMQTYLRDDEVPKPPYYEVPKPSPVKRLEGELRLLVPGRIHRLAFTPRDVGRSHDAGGFSVRLESLDGHRAMVSIRPHVQAGTVDIEQLNEQLVGKVILTARDESGRTLDHGSSSDGAPGGLEELQKLLDVLVTEAQQGTLSDAEAVDERIKARQIKLQQAHGAASFHGKAFHGQVAELDVILLDPAEVETRAQPLVLEPMNFDVPDNTAELVPFPVAATVYDHSLEVLDGDMPDDLEPASLADAITFRQGDFVAMQGARGKKVEFTYPEIASDRFMSSFDRFDDDTLELRFLDADGTPIAIPEDKEAREEMYRFVAERLEYFPGKFPRPPARVTGRLKINLMPNLQRQWVQADSLPEGAELIGNAYFSAPAYHGHEPQVFAQDRSGRYLRKLSEIRYAYDGEAPRDAHYFYGQPTRILLLRKGESLQPVEYAFDIDLTDGE